MTLRKMSLVKTEGARYARQIGPGEVGASPARGNGAYRKIYDLRSALN